MVIKSIKAFAIVNKTRKKLDVFEIYKDGEVMLNNDEVMIEVLISPVHCAIVSGRNKPVTIKKRFKK